MTTMPSIAIIGAGAMGSAILSGLLSSELTVTGGIRVSNRTEAKALPLRGAAVESFALESTPDANLRAAEGAGIVLIGVKPVMVPGVLAEIAPVIEPGALVVSVAAGVTTATMESVVSNAVVRAMPNTPAIIGRAITGIAAGSRATPDDLRLARQLFETVGTVLEVPEARIDALSAVSGSGPAYVFYLVEEFIDAAIGLGFSGDDAALLVRETFAGSIELLAASGSSPEELRRHVTSPGGTTERALAVFNRAQLADLFGTAMSAAVARAQELGRG